MKVFVALLAGLCSGFAIEKSHLAQSMLLPGVDNYITPFKIVDFNSDDEYVLKITCSKDLACPESLLKEVTESGGKLNESLKSHVLAITIQKDHHAWVKVEIKNKKTGDKKTLEHKFFVTHEIKVKKISNSEWFKWKMPLKLWEVLPPFDKTSLEFNISPPENGFVVKKFDKYIELHADKPLKNVTLTVTLFDRQTKLKSAELTYVFSAYRSIKRKILVAMTACFIAILTIGLVVVIVYYSGVSESFSHKHGKAAEKGVPVPVVLNSANHITLPIDSIQKEVQRPQSHDIRQN